MRPGTEVGKLREWEEGVGCLASLLNLVYFIDYYLAGHWVLPLFRGLISGLPSSLTMAGGLCGWLIRWINGRVVDYGWVV
ncbi:hypothetical protein [Caldivirga sp.]|uniref:hypothetical protein n=1 Tax=Caldivirga sp. TaxID=2080243 RepID=UPI003D12272B